MGGYDQSSHVVFYHRRAALSEAVLERLRAGLDVRVVGVVDTEAVVSRLSQDRPGAVFVEAGAKRSVELVSRLIESDNGRIPAIVLYDRPEQEPEALRAGAFACLPVGADASALGEVFRRSQEHVAPPRLDLASGATLDVAADDESRLRAIAHNPLVPVIALDDQGRFTFFNRAAERVTGYSASQVIGRSVIDFSADEDTMRAVWAVAQRDGAVESVSVEMRGADGRTIPLEMYAVATYGEDGGFNGIIALAVDMTRRRQMEDEASRRSRELAASNAIGQMLGRDLPFKARLEAALLELTSATGVDSAFVLLLDPRRGVLRLAAASGVDEVLAKRIESVAIDAGAEGRTLADGLTRIVPAAQDDPDVLPALQAAGASSVAVFPLSGSSGAAGSLTLCSARHWNPDHREQHLISSLVSQVSAAVVTEQLVQAARERVAQLAAINELGRRIVSLQERDVLLDEVARVSADLSGAHYAAIALVKPGADQLDFAIEEVRGVSYTPSRHTQPVSEGLIGRCLSEGTHIYAPDVAIEPNYLKFIPETKSELALPLRMGEEIMGVLDLQFDRADALNRELIAVYETVADEVALALHNHALFEAARKRSDELGTVSAIVEAAGRSPHIDVILKATLDRTIELVGADAGWIVLAAGDNRFMVRAAGPESRPLASELDVGRMPVVELTVVSGQTQEQELAGVVPEAAIYERLGRGHLISVPLSSKGWALGALVLYRLGPWRFSDDEKTLLSSAGAQVGVAIENAQLYQRSLMRTREVSLLLEIGQALNSDLSPSHVVRRVVRSAASLIHARGAAFGRFEGGGIVFRERLWDGEWVEMDAAFRIGDGIVGRTIERRRAAVSGRAPEPPLYESDVRARGGVREVVAVPVTGERGEPLGVIEVHDPESVGELGVESIALLAGLANQAAVALRNAELYDEARKRGETLSRLYEASRTIVATTSSDELIATILRAALSATGATRGSFFRYDADANVLTLYGAAGMEESVAHHVERELCVVPGQERGIVGMVAQSRRAYVVGDVRTEPLWVHIDPSDRSAVFTPVVAESELYGVLVLTADEPQAFGPGDTDLLTAFANQAAAVLRNAYAVERIRDGARREHLLNQINRAVRLWGDYTEAASAALVGILRETNVDRCVLCEFTREPDGSESLVVTHESVREGMKTIAGRRAPHSGGKYVHDVASSIELAVVRDVDDEARLRGSREALAELGVGAIVTAPVVYRGRVLALLEIHAQRGRIWTQWECNLLESVAGELAIAVENARLFRELEERVADLEALHAVGVEMGQTLNAKDVAERAVVFAQKLVRADTAALLVPDEGRRRLFTLASYPASDGGAEREMIVHVDEKGVAPAAFREGRPIAVRDVAGDARYGPGDQGAELAVPLLSRGNAVGVLFVTSLKANAFTDRDEQLLTILASFVGVSIENASLFAQLDGRLRDLEALHQVGLETGAARNTEAVLERVVDVVGELLDPFSTTMFVINERRRLVTSRVYRGKVPAPGSEPRQIDLDGPGIVPWVAREGRHYLSHDATQDPLYVATHDAVRSEIAVPLKVRGRVVGVLNVESRRTSAFDEKTLRMLTTLASQAAVALENASLFVEIEARASRLSVLHDLARALSASLDMSTLGREVGPRVNSLFPSASAFVAYRFHTEENDFTVLASGGLRSPRREGERVSVLDTPAGTVLRTRKPMIIADLPRSGRDDSAALLSAGVVSFAAVPVAGDDEVLGVLLVASEEQDAFGIEELNVLTTVAANLAVAMKNVRLYEDLQQTVTELRDTQEQVVMLEKLRAMGELASGVAHDFNNLLAGILGTAQLAQGDSEVDKVHARLKVIEQASLDGAETVRRIQEFARKRTHRELEVVDVDECVEQAVEVTGASWRHTVLKRGVRVEVIKALAAPPPIAGNAAEVREVIANLILNAVDAMPEGGTIRISTRRDDSKTMLEVSDTGVGMTEDVKRRIFDPFFTTKGSKGIGLGLSVVYGIVTRHEGLIEVESAQGKGTTFRITFPIATIRRPAPRPAAPVVQVASARIAVIDDDATVLAVVRDVLVQEGHTVVTFGEPRDFTLAHGAGDRYDVVLTNLGMPDVSGWEVAKQVRKEAPLTVVGVVTGWMVEEDPDTLFEKGVDFVVQKPFTAERLVRQVNEALVLRGQRVAEAEVAEEQAGAGT